MFAQLLGIPAGAAQSLVAAPATLSLPTRLYVEESAYAVADRIGKGAEMQTWDHHIGTKTATVQFWRADTCHRVRLSGGAIRLEVKHPRARDIATDGLWRDTAATRTAQRVYDIWGDEDEPEELFTRGIITHWSARSRRNMLYRLATLDHDTWTRPDWRLAMVTLTLPGDWLAVAPDGKTWKRIFARFVERWRDQFGWWECAWKQEFQDRGAPHMHVMTRVPDVDWRSKGKGDDGRRYKHPRGVTFREWLSSTWAACVKADRDMCHRCLVTSCECPIPDTEYQRHLSAGTNVDFGFRGTDPKRIAVYFLKHSAKTMDGKEYQHNVPAEWQATDEGPGRFWGVAGLQVLEVLMDLETWAWDVVKRVLRHWHKAQRARIALERRRHAIRGMGEATRRATLLDLRPFGYGKDRVLTDPLGGGWVLANDAPRLLLQIATWLRA